MLHCVDCGTLGEAAQKIVNVLFLRVFKGSLDEHLPGLMGRVSKVPSN